MYAKQRVEEVGILDTSRPVPEGIMTRSMAEKREKRQERKERRKLKKQFEWSSVLVYIYMYIVIMYAMWY